MIPFKTVVILNSTASIPESAFEVTKISVSISTSVRLTELPAYAPYLPFSLPSILLTPVIEPSRNALPCSSNSRAATATSSGKSIPGSWTTLTRFPAASRSSRCETSYMPRWYRSSAYDGPNANRTILSPLINRPQEKFAPSRSRSSPSCHPNPNLSITGRKP